MILLKEIVKMVRKKENDNNEIRFSDYDILHAVNDCIRYLNQHLSLTKADFLERIKKYRQDEINAQIFEDNSNLEEGKAPKDYVDFAISGVDLPSDFLTLVRVTRAKDGYSLSPIPAIENISFGCYKVFGNKIYCESDFDLLYTGLLPKVFDIENDFLDIPNIFTDIVVKLTCMILKNENTDILMQEFNDLTNSIIPKRRYSNVKMRMPFIV